MGCGRLVTFTTDADAKADEAAAEVPLWQRRHVSSFQSGYQQTLPLPSLLALQRGRVHAEGRGVLAFPPRKLVRRLLSPVLMSFL